MSIAAPPEASRRTHRIILHNEIVITATVRLMTDGNDDNDDRNDDDPRSQSIKIGIDR